MTGHGLMNSQNSILIGIGFPPSENFSNNLLADNSVHNSQSWRDLQIFLESDASGEPAPTHYNITDFISSTVEEEIVVGAMEPSQSLSSLGPENQSLRMLPWPSGLKPIMQLVLSWETLIRLILRRRSVLGAFCS